VAELDAASKSRTATKKRLGVFGNIKTSVYGDSAYGSASKVAKFGAVGA